jgi:hypothetical protein
MAFDVRQKKYFTVSTLKTRINVMTHQNQTLNSDVPLWVRFVLFATPNRLSASIYYWFFVAGILLFPVFAQSTDYYRADSRHFITCIGMAFFVFSAWSTSTAMRWLDRHGWDRL